MGGRTAGSCSNADESNGKEGARIMIGRTNAGGGGGRYSLLTITTEEATLQNASVTVTGTDQATGKVDTQTKNFVNGTVKFKLKLKTEYTITCDSVTNKVNVGNYDDYTATIAFAQYLYKDGNTYDDITGGYTFGGGSNYTGLTPTLYVESESATGARRYGWTVNKIDVSKFKHMDIVVTDTYGESYDYTAFGVFADTQNYLLYEGIQGEHRNINRTITLNIPEGLAPGHVGITTQGRYPGGRVKSILLYN